MSKFKRNSSLILSGFLILLNSCGGSSDTEEDFVVDEKYKAGKEIYDRSCVACHMADGKGLEGTFPPLADSDYLLDDPKRAINQVLEGSSDEMTVNGIVYNAVMPPQDVTDEEAVEVVNYILNAWGNTGGEVSISDINK